MPVRGRPLKQILLAAFFLASMATARGQIIIYPNLGVYGVGYNRLDAINTLWLPTGCGAPVGSASLNAPGQKPRRSALYADTCGKHIYWYVPGDSTWQRIDTGGGGGSGTVTAVILSHDSLYYVTGSGNTFVSLIVTQADSTVLYVTPTQLTAALGTKLSAISTQFSVTGLGTPGSPVQLVGDVNAPGNSYYYGTNGSGAKGFYVIPAGVTSANPSQTISGSVVNGSATTFMRSDGAPAIASNAVTNTLLAQAPTNTIKGNNTGGTANEADLTVAQINAMLGLDTVLGHTTALATIYRLYKVADSLAGLSINLNVYRQGAPGDTAVSAVFGQLAIAAQRDSSGMGVHHTINPDFSWTWYGSVFGTSVQGMAPASGGGTTNYLRADGTWAAPSGGGGLSDTTYSHPSAIVTQNQKPYHWNVANTVIGDSTVVVTAMIQKMIDSCHLNGGGTVFFPARVYLIDSLIKYGNTELKGEGYGSVLKANSATTNGMIQEINTAAYYFRGVQQGHAGISGLFIAGRNLLTIGIHEQFTYWGEDDNLRIDSCTQEAALYKGSLSMTLRNWVINDCPIGIDEDTTAVAGGVSPNLLRHEGLHIYRSSTWGIQCLNSQGALDFQDCDVTQCGTLHNPNTGGWRIYNQDPAGTGATFINCWSEVSNGSIVYIDHPQGSYESYNFIGSQWEFNSNASYGIREVSPSVPNIKINMEGTHISSDSVDVSVDGSGFVTMESSSYATFNPTGLDYNYVRDNGKLILGPAAWSNSAAMFISALKNGAGSGSSASVDANSTMMGFNVTVTVGSGATANDTVVIVGYPIAMFPNGAHFTMSCVSDNACALSGAAQVGVQQGGTYFYPYIKSKAYALEPGTYTWCVKPDGK